MANEQNLIKGIPTQFRSGEEAAETGRKGGIASGAARRRRKSLREAADYYLSLPVANMKRWNNLSKEGIDPEDVDNQMAIIVGLSKAAALGDAKAAKVLFDVLGEDGKSDDGGGVQIIDDL